MGTLHEDAQAVLTSGPMLTRRLLLAALTTPALTRVAHGEVAHRLTLLHLNDFHSRHEPVDARTLTCAGGPSGTSGAGDGCFGGSARLASAVAAARATAEADGRAVLLLDAGDQFQGSLFFTAHEGAAELAVMHALGTDAMAVGNHEFDRGPAVLARFATAARFPLLSANTDVENEPALTGLIRPYALFTRAGLRVAVVGLTPPDTATLSSPGPGVRFLPPESALAAAAGRARAEGAQLVIALSHLGLPADWAISVPGIAAVVGGHTHTLLSNTEPGALGPHPVAVPGGALVVQAGAYGRFLGRLDLDVAADGAVLAWGGDTRHVGPDLPEDPAVAAIVARFAAPLEEVRRRVVATMPETLDPAGCRVGECALGSLVADAMLGAAPGAQAAITNAGGLRAGLRAGDVTYAGVLEVLPFGNMLATMRLTGTDLRAALEHGLAQPGRGGFPQVAGLRLAWDPARPAGNRLTGLLVRDAGGDWAPVEPDRTYALATNSFLRGGGDGYAMLRDRAVDAYDAGPVVADLVADALARGAAVPAGGRITGR